MLQIAPTSMGPCGRTLPQLSCGYTAGTTHSTKPASREATVLPTRSDAGDGSVCACAPLQTSRTKLTAEYLAACFSRRGRQLAGDLSRDSKSTSQLGCSAGATRVLLESWKVQVLLKCIRKQMMCRGQLAALLINTLESITMYGWRL